MNNKVSLELSTRLKEARIAARMTQAEVARAFGISRQAVSAWERGAMPTVIQLRELGLLYAVSMDYVLYGIRTVPVSGKKMLGEIFKVAGTPACDSIRGRCSSSP